MKKIITTLLLLVVLTFVSFLNAQTNDGICSPTTTIDPIVSSGQLTACSDGSNLPTFALPNGSLPDVEFVVEINGLIDTINTTGISNAVLTNGDTICVTAFTYDLVAINGILNTINGLCQPNGFLNCDTQFNLPGLGQTVNDIVTGANDGNPGLNDLQEAIDLAGTFGASTGSVNEATLALDTLNMQISGLIGTICYATTAPECFVIDDSDIACPTTTNTNFVVSTKFFLEGFMENQSMVTALADTSLVPNNQIFNSSVLNYSGTENLTNYTGTDAIVDWVLLALLDLNGNVLEQKATLLTSNGMVVDSDSNSFDVEFSTVPNAVECHLAVFHKSHLAIISDTITSNTFVDFSVLGSAMGTVPTKNVNGIETLFGGDLNQDGLVNNLDYNIWVLDNALVNQYVNQDIDGNGLVNNLDYNLWDINKSKVGHPFVRF